MSEVAARSRVNAWLEAGREAHARGRSPQPALALVRLTEGKVKAASAAIKAAVGEQTWDRWARARLLPAQVEIAIAAGDLYRRILGGGVFVVEGTIDYGDGIPVNYVGIGELRDGKIARKDGAIADLIG